MTTSATAAGPRSTKTAPLPLEPLHTWQAAVGIPAGLVYLAGNAMRAAGLHTVPGPVLYAAALAILISIAPAAWRNLKRLRWRIPVYLLIGFIAFIATDVIWSNVMLNLGVPVESANDQSLLEQVHAAPLLMGLLIIVAGPIVEEVLYRFAIFRPLHQINPVLGHTVTALLFGLQHIAVAVFGNGNAIEWWHLPSYAAASLVLSLLYTRSRTLLIPIGVHMATNALGFMMMLG